jgi:hypothetical protein
MYPRPYITGHQPPAGGNNGFLLVGEPFTLRAITPPPSPIASPPGSPQRERWVATPVSSLPRSKRNARFGETMETGAGMARLTTAEQWRAFQRGPHGSGR